MSAYEIGILGHASAADRSILEGTIGRMIQGFGLTIGKEVIVRSGLGIASRDLHAATAAAYFGGTGAHPDEEAARELSRAKLPVIPTVQVAAHLESNIPPFLQTLNGHRRRAEDPELETLAAALLECVGLLRKQRRVFVSYRRTESRGAALQLHDLLTARGFDVFLDTHDIRPGEAFQEMLWNRLVDSDVMVMLDTPTYFESRWTRQELGRALAKNIRVLRIVWPGHSPTRSISLSQTISLAHDDLKHGGALKAAKARAIAVAVESLRSRSIASRYMAVTGCLDAELKKVDATIEGIGAHRAISVRLCDDQKVWAYPIVGIPTAELLHDIANKAGQADQRGLPVLVYDHVGIGDEWLAHLKWLDDNIRTVRAIRVTQAAWDLAAWEAS